MQSHFDPVPRVEQIAALYRRHAGQLERRVARCAYSDPSTIEDACSFAWLQLLTHTAVELSTPGDALGWLRRTAIREVWRLDARRARDRVLDHLAIERELQLREHTAPAADAVAAQHARLDLVAQVPERPRRFLMRLALGHTYREIAADENVSATTANKQIARAKRLLRALDLNVQQAAL